MSEEKKKRGRPRKYPLPDPNAPPKPRGRPKKEPGAPKAKYHRNKHTYDVKIPAIPKQAGQVAEEIAPYIEPQAARLKETKAMPVEERMRRTSERIAEQMEVLAKVYAAGKIDLNDSDTIFEQGMEYMRACMIKSHLPSLMEFAVTLGYTYQHVSQWVLKHPSSRTSDIWVLFRDAWTDLRLGLGLERVVDNVLGIYLANNSKTGLSNNPLPTSVANDPLEDDSSAEDVREKYADLE